MYREKLKRIAEGVVDRFLNEARTLSPEALNAMARAALESNHPGEREAFSKKLKDMGHDPEEIVRSFKAASSGQSRPRRQTSASPSRQPVPTWAWAGHAGGMPPSHHIYNNSYTDLNFIKKRMWDLSNQSKEEHTIHQFDGSYFRNTYTSYGHEGIYPEMANAMLKWGSSGNPYHTKAIFASTGNSKKLKLIWANGRHISPHVEVEHSSFNQNPSNDQHFMRGLSAWIDQKAQPQ